VIEVAKKPVSFDSKCYDLAEHFLTEEPGLNTEEMKDQLAQAIQETVESWINDERDKLQSKDPT
jgi:hypothetical protein